MFSIPVLLVLLLHQLQISSSVVNAASNPACSSGIYKSLLALSAYPPAEQYCSSHYPLPVKTVTATATLTIVNKRATTMTTSTKTTTTTPAATGNAAVWSSVLSDAASIIKTVCSCIETQSTTTTTLTTTTSTTTVAPACSTHVATEASGCKYQVDCFSAIGDPNSCSSSGPELGGYTEDQCIALCDSTPACVGIYYVNAKASCYLYSSTTGSFCQLTNGGYSPFADIAILVKDSCTKAIDQ